MTQNTLISNRSSIVDLNVGGVFYTASRTALVKHPGSLLSEYFSDTATTSPPTDSNGRYFIDRYILDYLRDNELTLPAQFSEVQRLKHEANYFRLNAMIAYLEGIDLAESNVGQLDSPFQRPISAPPSRKFSQVDTNATFSIGDSSSSSSGYINIIFRATFAFGKEGLADVQFRKLIGRILVHGRASLLQEAFGEMLNQSRDPDRVPAEDRYTSRCFLKHSYVEQAFDQLYSKGFRMVSSTTTSTGGLSEAGKVQNVDELRWQHFNQFIFLR